MRGQSALSLFRAWSRNFQGIFMACQVQLACAHDANQRKQQTRTREKSYVQAYPYILGRREGLSLRSHVPQKIYIYIVRMSTTAGEV